MKRAGATRAVIMPHNRLNVAFRHRKNQTSLHFDTAGKANDANVVTIRKRSGIF